MGHTVVAVLGGLVGLVVLGAYVGWLYRRLAVAPDLSPRWRRGVAVALGLGLGVFVVGAVLLRRGDPAPVRPVVWPAMTSLAVALYLTLGLALLALVALALRLRGRTDARRRVLRVGTPAVVALALAVTGYGVVAATRPSVRTTVVTSDALPASYDGLRVVLMTDLHVGALHDASWTRRVVDLVMTQDPDLVLLGGDLVDGRPEDIAADVAPLADLATPLGVHAVIGNHELITGAADGPRWVAAYESLGLDVLTNESVELGPGLMLAGVPDATATGDLAPDPAAALAGVDPDDFVLYLAHEPRQVHDLPDGAGVDLMLAGHTHGGQLWPVGLLSRLAAPVVQGYGVADGVPLLVSRGVGTSGPPVRVLSPPQVDVVVLRAT
ncbi:metallophosphoesterase [Nocardioides plantarum]|uniref:Metallophosphoesterase n=1 Tax=Nocardioides plantarum TaxID=29299 RepID=A0ABV5KFF1_9ACTN|nr:metallophosphoesterase [Nocardioides plantarum]